jgi:hypothetical protein
MPRYIVQRTFPEGFHIPADRDGAEICRGVIEAIRKTAIRNELPVDEITRVRVLDPYFYA